MKVLVDIASDIYLDSWISQKSEVSDFVKRILPENKNSEILILAGNVNSSLVTIEPFLLELKKYYKYIFYVHGNHEMCMFEDDISIYDNNSFKKIDRLKKLVKSIPGCGFLNGFDGQYIVLKQYNNLVISGLSMWWDYDRTKYDGHYIKLLDRKYSNNYKFIAFGFNRNTWKKNSFLPRSLSNARLFKRFYKILQKLPQSDIVVTHYSPLKLSEKVSLFTFFDGEEELKRLNPKVWICGHTFEKHNLKFDSTQIVTNPIGYGGFKKAPNNIQTIEIEK